MKTNSLMGFNLGFCFFSRAHNWQNWKSLFWKTNNINRTSWFVYLFPNIVKILQFFNEMWHLEPIKLNKKGTGDRVQVHTYVSYSNRHNLMSFNRVDWSKVSHVTSCIQRLYTYVLFLAVTYNLVRSSITVVVLFRQFFLYWFIIILFVKI